MTGPTVPSDQNGATVPPEAVERAAKAEYEYQRDVRETEWQYGKWETLANPFSRRRYIERAQRALAASGLVDAATVRAETANEIAEKIERERDTCVKHSLAWRFLDRALHIARSLAAVPEGETT